MRGVHLKRKFISVYWKSWSSSYSWLLYHDQYIKGNTIASIIIEMSKCITLKIKSQKFLFAEEFVNPQKFQPLKYSKISALEIFCPCGILIFLHTFFINFVFLLYIAYFSRVWNHNHQIIHSLVIATANPDSLVA